MFTGIFVTLMVAGWLSLAFLPWLGWSVATRGNAGLANLPLCLFAGVVAGLAVPILFRDDAWGLLLSGLAAFAVPLGLLAAQRVAMARPPKTEETTR